MNLMIAIVNPYHVIEYARVVLYDAFGCELLKNSQFPIIRISQSKPDLWYLICMSKMRHHKARSGILKICIGFILGGRGRGICSLLWTREKFKSGKSLN